MSRLFACLSYTLQAIKSNELRILFHPHVMNGEAISIYNQVVCFGSNLFLVLNVHKLPLVSIFADWEKKKQKIS